MTIDTNDYAYIYDNIGNNLYTSLNAVTNAYTVNNLNQYKAITNLLDLTGYRLGHDADGNTTRIDDHIPSYDAENRLAAYMFGNASTTGTVRSVYVYDHLARRVRKTQQERRAYDPGGMMPPTYWWHTNDVTTFVYDGWNLIHERVAHTNGTVDEIEYAWGLDLSGSLQGAGGVGGLLYEKRNGAIYIPCYDANGNITSYVDTNGTVRAYRQFDAFGTTVSKGGDMVDTLHFWFSTKYLDHDTGLYYYGYRYYSPILQRWINRDPIEESGGLNLYGFVKNNPENMADYLGFLEWLWSEVPLGVRAAEKKPDGSLRRGLTDIGWTVKTGLSHIPQKNCYRVHVAYAKATVTYWWSIGVPKGRYNLTPLQHELLHVRRLKKQWKLLENEVAKTLPTTIMPYQKAKCWQDIVQLFSEAFYSLAAAIEHSSDALDNGGTEAQRDKAEKEFRRLYNLARQKMKQCK